MAIDDLIEEREAILQKAANEFELAVLDLEKAQVNKTRALIDYNRALTRMPRPER